MANLIVQPEGWGNVPKELREAYKAQFTLLQTLIKEKNEFGAAMNAAPKGSEARRKAAKKFVNYNRWIGDVLQAPPDTFAGIDPTGPKRGELVHSWARKHMRNLTLDNRPAKQGGGTMHHLIPIMQTKGAFEGLNLGGIAELNQMLRDLNIWLATAPQNLGEVDDVVHRMVHSESPTGGVDYSNKDLKLGDMTGASLKERVDAITKSWEGGRSLWFGAENSPEMREMRERIFEPIRAIYGEDSDYVKRFEAGILDPYKRDIDVNTNARETLKILEKEGGLDPTTRMPNEVGDQIILDSQQKAPQTKAGMKLRNKILLGTALTAGSILGSARPGFADVGAAVADDDVVDEFHNKGAAAGSLKIAQNLGGELLGGIPGFAALSAASTAAPATTGAVMGVASPLLMGAGIAGLGKAGMDAYSRHLEHTTGKDLGTHWKRFRYQRSPLMNEKVSDPSPGYGPLAPKRDELSIEDKPTPEIKQDTRNPVESWWNQNVVAPVAERANAWRENFDPNRGDWGLSEIMYGHSSPADQLKIYSR